MHIYMRFPGGRQKAFTLSYDDGVRQDKKLAAIFNKYGLKCTFNVNTGMMGDEKNENLPNGRMSLKEMKETYVGHEVALHALTHPFLEQLSAPQATYEVAKDRENLEKMFGHIVRGMAYPYGTFSNQVVEILKNCGIAFSRTTISTHAFGIPENWLTLNPTCHHRDAKIFELIDKFLNNNDRYTRPQMFYLWGHAYEFDAGDEHNSWEHAEKVAAAVSGHEDTVWYATNIEIYDYVQAYKRLIFSFDAKTVYNPSTVPVYFAAATAGLNTTEFTVAPGETLKLFD